MAHKITLKEQAFKKLSKLAQLVIELEEAKSDLERFDIAVRALNLNLIQYYLTIGFSPCTLLDRVLQVPAFFLSSSHKSKELALFFYRQGFDINTLDSNQNNIAHACLNSFCSKLSLFGPVSAADSLELFKLFLSWGVNLEQKNKTGDSPLDILEKHFLRTWYKNSEAYEEANKIVQAAIQEVQSGEFKYQDELGQILPISPTDLALSLTDEDKRQMDLYRRKEYFSLWQKQDKLDDQLAALFSNSIGALRSKGGKSYNFWGSKIGLALLEDLGEKSDQQIELLR